MHNGNITIKHSHRPVLVIKIKKREKHLFCSQLRFALSYNGCIITDHYYYKLQTVEGKKKKKKGTLVSSVEGMVEIQLTRSMICHVSNMR